MLCPQTSVLISLEAVFVSTGFIPVGRCCSFRWGLPPSSDNRNQHASLARGARCLPSRELTHRLPGLFGRFADGIFAIRIVRLTGDLV